MNLGDFLLGHDMMRPTKGLPFDVKHGWKSGKSLVTNFMRKLSELNGDFPFAKDYLERRVMNHPPKHMKTVVSVGQCVVEVPRIVNPP